MTARLHLLVTARTEENMPAESKGMRRTAAANAIAADGEKINWLSAEEKWESLMPDDGCGGSEWSILGKLE
ncbi:MAG: hypothetical protein AB7S92_05445 [Parvibaculaceae bacterium]